MGPEATYNWQAGVASALEWWRDAGVDVLVEDVPHDWLAQPLTAAPSQRVVEAVAESPPETLPETLADFVAWRLGPNAPEASWHVPLVAPRGPEQPKLVIFTDMPCEGDREALLSGQAGQLFDRMLAAIGLERESVYLASLAVGRPIGVRVYPETESRLIELARHHLRLLKPERLLLFGRITERILDAPANPAEEITLFGCKTRAVATYHPRFLISHPMAKAQTWKHLLSLTRGNM